jgi:hypothetical protein
MLVPMRGLLVILFGGLAVAACASDGGSLGDAVPLASVSVPLPRPAPKSTAPVQAAAAQDAKIWPHHPYPVSVQQFNEDKAKCTNVGNNASGAGSPEMKFYLVFTNCMRSEGYDANL